MPGTAAQAPVAAPKADTAAQAPATATETVTPAEEPEVVAEPVVVTQAPERVQAHIIADEEPVEPASARSDAQADVANALMPRSYGRFRLGLHLIALGFKAIFTGRVLGRDRKDRR